MACQLVNPIFLQYHDSLRSFIQKRVKDKSATHDILQQVLLKIYSHCEKLPEVKNVKAWVFQITRNSVYDYFNAESKRVDLCDDILDEDDTATLSKEILEYIRPMIALLPPKYAVPLTMSDLDNIPQKDVADKLGLSLSATKSRIQRGREKLRNLFFECCNVETDKKGNLIGVEAKKSCETLQRIGNSIK